jgi:hypothetical protein
VIKIHYLHSRYLSEAVLRDNIDFVEQRLWTNERSVYRALLIRLGGWFRAAAMDYWDLCCCTAVLLCEAVLLAVLLCNFRELPLC